MQYWRNSSTHSELSRQMEMCCQFSVLSALNERGNSPGIERKEAGGLPIRSGSFGTNFFVRPEFFLDIEFRKTPYAVAGLFIYFTTLPAGWPGQVESGNKRFNECRTATS